MTYIIVIDSEKLAEATRKYASLKSELHEAQENDFCKGRSSIKHKILKKKNVPARKMQELKLAFSEFYLSLILLQNYQNLNFTGFRKILKKHDKVSHIYVHCPSFDTCSFSLYEKPLQDIFFICNIYSCHSSNVSFTEYQSIVCYV